MNESPEHIDLIRQWVQKAENDLIVAEHSMTIKDNCPLDIVCYHVQQCVEKYIKALLIFQKINFPKTHDIGILISLLPKENNLGLTNEEQERLTDYATVTRYPGDWEPISRVEADVAVAIARKAREKIRAYLPEEAI